MRCNEDVILVELIPLKLVPLVGNYVPIIVYCDIAGKIGGYSNLIINCRSKQKLMHRIRFPNPCKYSNCMKSAHNVEVVCISTIHH
jgi:hypothetical protein